ncbi:MAG: hypothetical protein AAB395_03630 [Patescibacteria group bacterium]
MKYHHQKGIIQKDKKGHKKLWFVFFVLMIIATYCAMMFTVLDLNGWPLSEVDATAKTVKTTKPTDNKLFIPAINVTADNSSVKLSGDPSYDDVTASGSDVGFGITPSSLRKSSPFYNLDQLKDGDEIYLDSEGIRYVYKVTKSVGEEEQKLTIKTKQDTIVAKTIGTVSWNNGKPALETF